MGEVVSGGVAILLEDGLQAGQLMHDDADARIPPTKEFVGFEVDPGSGAITFRRNCTRAEKKKLGKMLHGDKTIRRVRQSTASGETCLMFVSA